MYFLISWKILFIWVLILEFSNYSLAEVTLATTSSINNECIPHEEEKKAWEWIIQRDEIALHYRRETVRTTWNYVTNANNVTNEQKVFKFISYLINDNGPDFSLFRYVEFGNVVNPLRF